jgi:hypothetical protein
MNTKLSKCGPQNRWLAPVVFAFVAGCFPSPTPKLDRLICTTDQQCPVGYTCRVKGQPGGCCKDRRSVLRRGEAATPERPTFLRLTCKGSLMRRPTTEAPTATCLATVLGTRPPAVPEVPGMGPLSAAPEVRRDASLGSAAGDSGGGTASDGAAGSGGGTASDGNDASAGGSGGSAGGAGGNGASGGGGGSGGARLDAAPDVPPDVPAGDAPGTCGADQDCPSQSPLCLGYRCAKCTADTDCAGRSGTPACLTSSGLCVGCTANSHCGSSATTCNTTTHQCVGCVKPERLPGRMPDMHELGLHSSQEPG